MKARLSPGLALLLGLLGLALPGVAAGGVLLDGYPAPQGASPLRVPLLPAYNECSTPNRAHGAPLAFPSWAPPVTRSQSLTVGTRDNNGALANSIGSIRFNVVNGAGPNDSDVGVTLGITDVRCKPGVVTCGSSNSFDGPDYIGAVKAQWIVRITDRLNAVPPGGGPDPATMVDIPFPVPAGCTATAGTSIGATCATTTTLNATVPGSITEARRSIWEFGPIRVDDGGADGDTNTNPNTTFAVQGVFVP